MTESVKPLDFTNLPAKLVTALGKVTARSGQIEHLLVVTLRRTTGDTWEDVFTHAKGKRGDERRSEAKQSFKTWAKGKFGEVESGRRIQEFNNAIDRIGRVAARRNSVIHSAWGVDASSSLYATNKGKLLRSDAGNPLGIRDVEEIADELHECLFIINAATNPNLVSPTPERDESFAVSIPKHFVVSSSASAVVSAVLGGDCVAALDVDGPDQSMD
jgi:hypothetical protein